MIDRTFLHPSERIPVLRGPKPKPPRFPRPVRAAAGYTVGLASAAAGAGGVFGWWWSAVVAGVGVAGWFVFIYDVDGEVLGGRDRDDG